MTYRHVLETSAAVAAMDMYLAEKADMGLLSGWYPSVLPYVRLYNGVRWSGECKARAYGFDPPTRFWCAHAGTFTDLLMPELHRIALEKTRQILVEPYLEQQAANAFWRLEVDEDKERLGVWEFKEGITVASSDLLHLKFKVWSPCNSGAGPGECPPVFVAGAMVEQ